MKRELALHLGKKPATLDDHLDLDDTHPFDVDRFINDWTSNPKPVCCAVRTRARTKSLASIDIMDVPYSLRIAHHADKVTVTDGTSTRVLKDRQHPEVLT